MKEPIHHIPLSRTGDGARGLVRAVDDDGQVYQMYFGVTGNDAEAFGFANAYRWQLRNAMKRVEKQIAANARNRNRQDLLDIVTNIGPWQAIDPVPQPVPLSELKAELKNSPASRALEFIR